MPEYMKLLYIRLFDYNGYTHKPYSRQYNYYWYEFTEDMIDRYEVVKGWKSLSYNMKY